MAYRRGTRGENLLSIIGLLLVVGVVVALVLPAMQADRGSHRSELLSNTRNVGMAAINFASGHEGQLPPALPDTMMEVDVENGVPKPQSQKPISFLTTLLPYLEQPRLYEQIDKSVVWTHPRNRDAYGTRVSTFEWPEQPSVDHENDKTPAGFAVTYIVPSSRIVSRPGEPFRMEDITDGTTNTIMLGNIDDAFVPAWGDPAAARDPALGFAGGPYAFGGFPERGANVVFADGHTDFLSKNIDPKVARALATPAGGEVVTTEDY